MLRLYLPQNYYDLSDEAAVAEIIDSRAFSEFCGVDSSKRLIKRRLFDAYLKQPYSI